MGTTVSLPEPFAVFALHTSTELDALTQRTSSRVPTCSEDEN